LFKKQFTPGEGIKIQIDCNNSGSNCDIKNIKLKLLRKAVFKYPS